MIDSKWYMEAEGRAREVCACRDILEWLRTRSRCPWPNHNFFCVCVRVRVCVSFSADDRWHCFISRVLQRRRGPGRVRLRTCRWDECVELCLLWNLVYFSLSFFELLPRSFSSLSIMSHGSFKCNLKKKRPLSPSHPEKVATVSTTGSSVSAKSLTNTFWRRAKAVRMHFLHPRHALL